jgi:L-fuconolactonase
MMIDAHQHFWRLDRGDYGWLTPALAPIYRDFGPGDLRPLLIRHGIEKTMLVQAAPTLAETRYLLDLAGTTDFVAGVIGWVDFEARNAPDIIASLATDPTLVGVRPMVQDIPDDDWLMKSELAPTFEALVAHGVVFDALVLPRHLPRLISLIERHPNLAVVVDHGGKPPIRDGVREPWASDMAAIAANSRVVCKLSGLVTEAAPGWTTADLRPYVDHLIDVFGPRRLLWGSDWPVVNLAGGYERWRQATDRLLAPLASEERRAVLGENAARVYRVAS